MRERLIEILGNLDCNTEYCKDCEFCEDIDGCTRRQNEIIADKLIASGVVIPVRCKDCIHRVEESKMCMHPKAIGWDAIEPDDGDFCSYGERKEDNNA